MLVTEANAGNASEHTPEGVTQFQLAHQLAHHIECDDFAEMNSWRSYLYRLGLIGQDIVRYQGYSFGNISHREAPHSLRFVISGSQTGGLPLLCREHYALVNHFELKANFISAKGPVKPSSESLTHAAIYEANHEIQSVIHVHSPIIWQLAERLDGVDYTHRDIPYGTPRMAQAVKDAVQSREENCGIIIMLGHEDGVIAYGESVQQSGSALLGLLTTAHHLAEHSN